jgi:hypothetical protein
VGKNFVWRGTRRQQFIDAFIRELPLNLIYEEARRSFPLLRASYAMNKIAFSRVPSAPKLGKLCNCQRSRTDAFLPCPLSNVGESIKLEKALNVEHRLKLKKWRRERR